MTALVTATALLYYAILAVLLALWRLAWKAVAVVVGACAAWKVEREFEAGHDAEVAEREHQLQGRE